MNGYLLGEILQCHSKLTGPLVKELVAGCLVANIHHQWAKEMIDIDNELGIPVLATDRRKLNGRDSTAKQFRTRVEQFTEMLRGKRKGL